MVSGEDGVYADLLPLPWDAEKLFQIDPWLKGKSQSMLKKKKESAGVPDYLQMLLNHTVA